MTAAPVLPLADDAGDDVTVDFFFPLIPRDWLTGSATFAMSNEQRGAFMQLLCHAWLQKEPPAALPDNEALLAKMADMALERWREVGAPVLEQFPVHADGYRRNPKQAALYADALERRGKAVARARKAAAARYGRPAAGGDAPRVLGADTEQSMAPASGMPYTATATATNNSTTTTAERGGQQAEADANRLGMILTGFPLLADWKRNASPARWELLRRLANAVAKEHGVSSVAGFVAVLNEALTGGTEGFTRTHAELERALGDFLDTAKGMNKNALRAYLRGARPASRGAGSAGAVPARSRVATTTKLSVE